MTERDTIMNRLYTSLKTPDIIKDLNEFHGDVKLLYQFIKDVNEIITLCKAILPNDEEIPTIFIKAIRNKIKGEANQVLINADTETTWDSIKAALIEHYSDPRSEVALIRDLHRTRQGVLTSKQFYVKILEIQTALIAHANIQTCNADIKKDLYKEMCLAQFISNLREPLGSNIRSRDPNSLTEAMDLCVTEENMYYLKYQPTFRKPTNNFKPNLNQNPQHYWQNSLIDRPEQPKIHMPSTSNNYSKLNIRPRQPNNNNQPTKYLAIKQEKNINITQNEPPLEEEQEQEVYSEDNTESNEEFFREYASDDE